ncbi:hypothetical protein Gohar_016914 [Gossypium harknessii]|uniref:Uncharacterized protein n=1 Tax=Gossypium harknessii TaxID=34285 RepID=A0A7J9G5I8_9ROSI|nr:hypothetical protein [Gossypium harknessii]
MCNGTNNWRSPPIKCAMAPIIGGRLQSIISNSMLIGQSVVVLEKPI